MRRFALLLLSLVASSGVQASWYWPFGSDDDGSEPLRISELMEPATVLIDEASDLAAEGKVDESVEKYRKALAELDRIELENPERAKSSEFATLRNKRAYVNAAIDSMLLSQVKSNAKAVAVSDTTELERKLAEEKAKAKPNAVRPSGSEKAADKPAKKAARKPVKAAGPAKPLAPREQVIAAIEGGDFDKAGRLVDEMLRAKPNGAMALNLKAAMEMRQGKLQEAEATLDRAIMSNPRNHSAYYNMTLLMLRKDPENVAIARRYYETGRAMGGPEDKELEALLK